MLPTVEAQAALAKLGYYGHAIDGDYTSAAFRDGVRRLQRSFHPAAGEVDGWYGPKTDAVLAPMAAKLRSLAPTQIVACQRWTMGDYVIGNVRGHGVGQVPIYDQDGGGVIAQVAAGAYVEAVMMGESLLADGVHAIAAAGWRDLVGPDHVLFKQVLGIARRNHWWPSQPKLAGIELTSDGLLVRRVRTFQTRALGVTGWPTMSVPWTVTRTRRGGGQQESRELVEIERDPFNTALAPRGAFEIGERVFVLELAGQAIPDRGGAHSGWLTITGFTTDGTAELHIFAGVKTLRDRGPTKRHQPVHVWTPRFDAKLCPLCNYELPGHEDWCRDHPVPRI